MPFLPAVSSRKKEVWRNATDEASYNIIPRAEFDQLLSSFYPNKPIPTESDTRSDENHPHKLGLLFMVLAMGSLFNLEMEPEMESGKRFYVCCAQCLAVGDLMRQNTMASLQTLVSGSGCTTRETWTGEAGNNGDGDTRRRTRGHKKNEAGIRVRIGVAWLSTCVLTMTSIHLGTNPSDGADQLAYHDQLCPLCGSDQRRRYGLGLVGCCLAFDHRCELPVAGYKVHVG